MTSHPDRAQVRAAVFAMLKARNALHPTRIPTSPKALRRPIGADATSVGVQRSEPKDNPSEPMPPTPEAIEAAQEAALQAFPEDVRTAARLAFKEGRIRTDVPAPVRRRDFSSPYAFPTNLPPRPSIEVPPFPEAGLDDRAVHKEWSDAHRAIAEATFRLQPKVLRAYAEAQLSREKWNATQRGRKPSGDLRHPVPRDRLERITAELTVTHDREIARATKTIKSIETGDVVAVEYLGRFDDDEADYLEGVPILILQSDIDRKAAAQRAKKQRTPEEIEAHEAEWDAIVAECLKELPPSEPEVVIPDLPELPIGREPTAVELARYAHAIGKHLTYMETADKIEEKRKRDAATKVRTAATKAAEQADREGTAEAKKLVKLSKAAERQRRWRERRKIDKGAKD